MEYSKLVAVTGLSGLFELISSKADGGIVKSLDDKSTKFVSNRVHSFSHIESIEVYTTGDNVNLSEIFIAMKDSSESLPSANDVNAIKAYFGKVYPSMDFERVYGSDMKKMIKWFEIISANNIEIKLSEHSNEPGMDMASEKKPAAAAAVAAAPKAVKNAPAKKVNAPRKMA